MRLPPPFRLPLLALGGFLLCLGAQAGGAAPELADQYREGALTLLSRLRADGIEEFGYFENSVSLSRLETAVSEREIRFLELDAFTKPRGANRNTAFYVPEEKAVYLNRSARHDPQIIPFLALHELLGAYGLHDPDYQISIGAYFYLRPRGENESADDYRGRRSLTRGNMGTDAMGLFANPEISPRPLNDPDQRLALASEGGEGGGTKVGGGGDGEGIAFKIRFMEVFLREPRFFMPVSIFGSGAWLQIELTDEPALRFERQEAPVVYRKDIPRAEIEALVKRWNLARTRPAVRILVPRSRAGERGVTEEILHFLEGLLPTRGLERSFDCEGKYRSYRPLAELHPATLELFPHWRERAAAFERCEKKRRAR